MSYLSDMQKYVLYFLDVWLLVYVLIKALTRKNWMFTIFALISWAVYVYVLLSVTITERQAFAGDHGNTILFLQYQNAFTIYGGKVHIQSYIWMWEIINNIILFIPMGILVGDVLHGHYNILVALVLGFMMTCAIEASQYIFQVGMCDVDDIFNNTMGMLIGYVIWKMIDILIVSKKQARQYDS